jgi:hypothetical protein
MTVGSRGVTKTVGIPGTGVFYTSRHGYHTGYHSAAHHAASIPAPDGTPQQPAPAKAGKGCLIVVLIFIGLALLVVL